MKYAEIREKGIETIETRLQFKNGTILEVMVSSAPIDLQDLSLGVTFTIVDITERKQAEHQLQRYAADLQEANAELSQYAYVVSHDLQAPLRAVRNYADFLREDLGDSLKEEQRSYLDGLDRAVREATELIHDILELSRVGRQIEESENVEVGALIRTLLESVENSENIEIMMTEEWPTLEVEPVLLRQIFQNLIQNALKFNQSSPKRIEIGWRDLDEAGIEYFVRDNGIGIKPEHQAKIFRVFERLHTREEFEGTGIGLAIVRKAVGKLGGTIRIESELGEGSTFFITLPNLRTCQVKSF